MDLITILFVSTLATKLPGVTFKKKSQMKDKKSNPILLIGVEDDGWICFYLLSILDQENPLHPAVPGLDRSELSETANAASKLSVPGKFKEQNQ